MHLVLATQSLQGKLSAELRNNIDLRITLRQNEPADSTEVLGVPDAVGIPGRLRGRAMVLCTKDESRRPKQFQSGYLGDPPPGTGGPMVQVRSVPWAELGEPVPAAPPHPPGPTDLELTIRAVEEAAAGLALPSMPRPLLPPLAGRLTLEELPAPGPGALAFGLLDDPVAQRQPVAALELGGTDRLLIAGGPQSGRTTAARALLTSIATTTCPDEVHVYVLEHQPAGLSAYEQLPHCGGVISASEPDRVRRFVTWLDAEVRRRAAARFAPADRPGPGIVVIVDGWELFENRGDPLVAETSLPAVLRGVVSAGPPLGVHVVAIGGQDLAQGKLSALYSRRLLLPFPNQDVRRGHLPGGVVSPPLLPGRAIDAATGLHLQVAETACSPEGLVSRAPASGDPDRRPKRFPAIPSRVTLPLPGPPRGATWLTVGVGGPEVGPIGLDLFAEGPQGVLVSGPAGSGRTSAAAVFARALHRAGIGVVALCPPRSPLPGLLPADGIRVVTGTTVPDADLRQAASVFGSGPFAVVVDDCEQLTLVPREAGYAEEPTLLAELAGPDALGRAALVLCGDVVPVLSGQRRSLLRVVNEVMTTGTRILLCPSAPAVAREQGFSLEADQFFTGPPGRGYLARGRTTDLIQFAASEPPPEPPTGAAAVGPTSLSRP
jgi:S-DNA-T family DNA segregation ATPase FtsK/SpoIIIE